MGGSSSSSSGSGGSSGGFNLSDFSSAFNQGLDERDPPPEPLGDGGLGAMIQALLQGASSREAQLISQYGGTDGRRR